MQGLLNIRNYALQYRMIFAIVSDRAIVINIINIKRLKYL